MFKAQQPTAQKTSEANHSSFWDYVPIVGTIRAHRALEREMDKTLQEIRRDRQQVQKDIEKSREDAQKFREEIATREQELRRENDIDMGM